MAPDETLTQKLIPAWFTRGTQFDRDLEPQRIRELETVLFDGCALRTLVRERAGSAASIAASIRIDGVSRAPYAEVMSHPADTLERFVDHLTRGFTPELAKHFAELPKPDPEFRARLDELATKANEGSLTDEESREYDKYVQYMDFVAYMRLKVRSRAATSAP